MAAKERLTQWGWLRPLATLAFVIVLATVFSPRAEGFPIFWRGDNLANVLRQISDIGILAMGMTLVIISGGIDLSVGSLLALSCTIFAYIFTSVGHGWSPVAGAAAATMRSSVCRSARTSWRSPSPSSPAASVHAASSGAI